MIAFSNSKDKIIVTLHKDGSASIRDNGRGIPIHHMKEEKMTALEVVFSILHAGGKFDKEAYQHSGGLHGVGVSVVNALSARLKAVVYRDGREHTIVFAQGKKVGDITSKPSKSASGTFVRFIPDTSVFKKVIGFDPEMVETKLLELSYLCKGLTVEFIDEINDTKEVFSGGSGISDFVKHLASGKLLSDMIAFSNSKDKIIVDIAFQWLSDGSDAEIIKYYTNNIPNLDGGSHMSGFKSALTRTVNTFISNSDLPKSLKVSLSGDDIREGIVAIVSIRHPSPRFSSQTKDKLVSEDARTAVEQIVSDNFMGYLEQNPPQAKKIITRCVNAWKAREAAKKAREAVRKSVMSDGTCVLPGKLADCQERDPAQCEIFIVEGDSAGGSSKQGRNRKFQAILPLRGKVLNIEKSEFQKMIKNEEIVNLITAIGGGIGRTFDAEKIRYHKIIICTDADVDGSHIRALLLTFFFRQMPQLIENGHIYIAVPPLYRISFRGRPHYLKDDEALKQFIKEKKLNKAKLKLQRFKGLGEMNPGQLWETTMNPNTRTLLQITIGNYLEADRVFSILMGNQVEPRRNFVIKHSELAHLDV
jgi:DNA gyrase subunit B